MVDFSPFIFIMLIISYALAYDRCLEHVGMVPWHQTSIEDFFLLESLHALKMIRCINSDLCSKSGTKVMLMDLNTNTHTDFMLSNKAFRAMAKPGKDRDILKLGIANVEYKSQVKDTKGGP
ncbi:Expansin-like A2 [Bienertia sinuspersici]